MKFITLLSVYGSTSRRKELPFLKVGDAGHLTQGYKIKDFGLTWGVHDETRQFSELKESLRETTIKSKWHTRTPTHGLASTLPCTRFGRLHIQDFKPYLLNGYAMLMRPNNAETADHGCLWVIWFCACVRYWPGLVFECVTCFYCLFLICHFYFWSDRSSFMKKRVKRSNLLQPLGEYQNPLSLFLLPVLSKAIFFLLLQNPVVEEKFK